MTNIIRNYGRYVAIAVLAAVLITLIPTAMGGFKMREANASGLSADDKKVAADISNTTGAKIEEVLELKAQGNSWNEILERLKGRGESSKGREQREGLLTSEGIGKEDMERLKKEGFTVEEIMEAKLLVERILFQLHEITGEKGIQATVPKVEAEMPGGGPNKREDDSLYTDLAGKVDMKAAVSLMLKLKKNFGGLEKVLDEYLFALQAGLNLEDYITDKKGYLKRKEEKSLTTDREKIVTIAKIEERMLKKVQESNSKMKTDLQASPKADTQQNKFQETDNKPKPPIPEVKNVKPKNPAEDIMNEIKQVNPVGQ